MKQIYVTILGAVLMGTASYAQTTSNAGVATFEDLGLAAESHWNGAGTSTTFQSGDYLFANNITDFGGGATMWDGFAYASYSSSAYTSFDDQFNCCVGSGVNESLTYAVVYYNSYGTAPTVTRADQQPFESTTLYVTNASYAYNSMMNGDEYAKKFGAEDWFLLTITGYLEDVEVGHVDHYLAKDGKIVDQWQNVSIRELGTVDKVTFKLTSSDTGEWGMNTPAYFCLDNFNDPLNVDAIHEMKASKTETTSYDLNGRRSTCDKGFVIKEGRVTFVK